MTVSSIQSWGDAATSTTGAADGNSAIGAPTGSTESMVNLLDRLVGVLNRAGKSILEN